ncbi:Uncharacterised protein [Vibrio cholerae]|nr:Uncharacterised protein [Vibrio cholerae]
MGSHRASALQYIPPLHALGLAKAARHFVSHVSDESAHTAHFQFAVRCY